MLRAAQSPPPSNQKAEIKATRLTLAPLKLRLLPPGAGCNEGPLRGRLAPDPGPGPLPPHLLLQARWWGSWQDPLASLMEPFLSLLGTKGERQQTQMSASS